MQDSCSNFSRFRFGWGVAVQRIRYSQEVAVYLAALSRPAFPLPRPTALILSSILCLFIKKTAPLGLDFAQFVGCSFDN